MPKKKTNAKPAAVRKKTSAAKATKAAALPAAVHDEPKIRVRKLKRRQRKIRARQEFSQTKVPAAYRIMWRSLKHMAKHWKIFGGILLIYTILMVVLVKGIPNGSFSLPAIRKNLELVYRQGIGTDLALLGVLVGGTGSTASESGTVYQSIVVVIFSLATIWALRQTMAGRAMKMRDAFYRGMTPLATFLLVLLVVGLQCVPFMFASLVYSIIAGSGLAVTLAEKIIWGLILVAGTSITIFFLSSSIFALYIVTLPNMTPLRALRSARSLVRYRRFMVIRKVVFLPAVLLTAAFIIVMPLIIFATPAAEPVYLLVTILAFAVSHGYLYNLYRELITSKPDA